MMASLVFCAFSVEAKINFVGWWHLEDGWPERASLREKINLLNRVLGAELDWGQRPLQSIAQLTKVRNTFAHGQPEFVDEERIDDVEPEVWESLKSDWEESVNMEFLQRCREDERALWVCLLERAGIEEYKTITAAEQSLKVLMESAEGEDP